MLPESLQLQGPDLADRSLLTTTSAQAVLPESAADISPLSLLTFATGRGSLRAVGIYFLALLPLLVTLLFLGVQLTPWGDACPEEAPCEEAP